MLGFWLENTVPGLPILIFRNVILGGLCLKISLPAVDRRTELANDSRGGSEKGDFPLTWLGMVSLSNHRFFFVYPEFIEEAADSP